MPVVNREVERELVKRARSRGMNDEQIKQAVTAYRAQAGQQPSEVQSAQPTAPTEKKPGALQSIAQGVAKPFLKLGSSVAGIAEGAVDLARGDVQGANEALSRERDFGYFGSVRPIGINEQGQQKGAVGGIKDILGTGAEIGSYVVPGAGALKGVKSVATGGIRALPRVVADQALLGGASGVLGGAGAEAQRQGSTAGSILGGGLAGGAVGGAVGGALPIAGATVRGITNTAGRVGAEVLGRATGAGESAIREAFNNPAVIKFARQAGKDGPEQLLTQSLEEAQKGLKKLAENRGKTYRSALEKIKLDKRSLDNIVTDVRNTAKQLLADNDIKLVEGKLLNNLNFEKSAIEGGQNSVQKAFNTVMGWTDNTPAGLDTLKKKLGKFYNAIPRDGAGDARSFVLDLRNSVDTALKDNVKGYTEMTAGWREATEIIDEIQSALSLKDTSAKDTAVRKLMSTMRQNNELRREMLGVLGEAGGKDITGKIAGATLSPATPRGLAGVLQPSISGAGVFSSIINPASLPWLLTYLATSSPRLVAEAVALLGQVKGKVIPPRIQAGLRNLLIQAANSFEDNQQGPVPPTTEQPVR